MDDYRLAGFPVNDDEYEHYPQEIKPEKLKHTPGKPQGYGGFRRVVLPILGYFAGIALFLFLCGVVVAAGR